MRRTASIFQARASCSYDAGFGSDRLNLNRIESKYIGTHASAHLQELLPARGSCQVRVDLVVDKHVAVQPIPALSNYGIAPNVFRREHKAKIAEYNRGGGRGGLKD